MPVLGESSAPTQSKAGSSSSACARLSHCKSVTPLARARGSMDSRLASCAAEIATIAELTAQAAHMKHFSRPVSAPDLIAAIEAVEALSSNRKDAAE